MSAPMQRAQSILKEVFGFENVLAASGKDHCPSPGEKGCPGRHAHGRGQVSLLPDPRNDLRRPDDRGVAAHLSDEGSGGPDQGIRRAGPFPEQLPEHGRVPGKRHEAPGKRREAPLSGPGGPVGAANPCTAGRPEGGLHRHRRGALHLPVGSRLPSGVPATGGGPCRFSCCGLRSADGHGHAACSGGYPAIPEYRRSQ